MSKEAQEQTNPSFSVITTKFCEHEGEASLEMVTKLLGQTVEHITMRSFKLSF